MDTLTPEQRRRNMQSVRAADTKPERLLRSALHALGLRFRLNVKELAGKPDLVFPKYAAAVFVNGCLWHGHRCHLFKWPTTQPTFWRRKIEANTSRDKVAVGTLLQQGWRVLVIWECALRGPRRRPMIDLAMQCKAFITGKSPRYRQLRSSLANR